jgi:polar amino acid transport system substrate-binding protein
MDQFCGDKMRILKFWVTLIAFMFAGSGAVAQNITVATVDREPFSMMVDDDFMGFSIDLMTRVAQELDLSVSYKFYESFGEMLTAVESGQVDAAIANISITAERERRMDFSQPMFGSGIQVMVPSSGNLGGSVFNTLFTRDIGIAILAALGLLFGGGMLMWFFERRVQPYFDRPFKEAGFPAFWWALNLVVNGGFEERMPQSRPGRFFAVILVISSLFVVSIFVAQITAATTVNAINDSIGDLSDLDGKRVGTIEDSTSAAFLNLREINQVGYQATTELFEAFEAEELDAVVFDGPILAYYAAVKSSGNARVLDRVYRPENYGIAFPSDSELRERIDRVLLGLREDGTFAELSQSWFGSSYSGY